MLVLKSQLTSAHVTSAAVHLGACLILRCALQLKIHTLCAIQRGGCSVWYHFSCCSPAQGELSSLLCWSSSTYSISRYGILRRNEHQIENLLLQVPLPESPAWWDLFNVAKQDLLEVACEVLSLYKLPKAEYAPISKDAQREQRHLAALQQTAASPISGRPTPARSPGTASAGAVHQLDLGRDAAAAPAGDHGSDEPVNSAGQASSALQQVSLPFSPQKPCLVQVCRISVYTICTFSNTMSIGVHSQCKSSSDWCT